MINIIFLATFLVTEMTLIIITFCKKKERVMWLKNRMYYTAIEVVVLVGGIFLSGTGKKSRYFLCFGLLLISFLIDAVSYYVKRRRVSGMHSKVHTILSGLFGVVLFAALLSPAILITDYEGVKTSGRYEVKQTQAILTDESRKECFEEDGSFREVPVHFYYPSLDEGDETQFPLVLFSHGAFGYYQSNDSTYRELASNGYIVVSMDHPYHSFFTEDTDGKMIIVNSQFVQDVTDATNGSMSDEQIFAKSMTWLTLRCEDEEFVLNSIEEAKQSSDLSKAWFTETKDVRGVLLQIMAHVNTDKIGLMGHSLGGATAVQIGRNRSDIDAVIDIDGTMFGEQLAYENGSYIYNDGPYPIPLMEFGNEAQHNAIENEEMNKTFTYVNNNTIKKAKDGRFIWFKGAEHMDFTDLPLFSPILARLLGKGTVDSEKFIPQMNGIILQFYDYYLKGKGKLSLQDSY